MKITLKKDGKTFNARQPFVGSSHVEVKGLRCTGCDEPLKACGVGHGVESFDTVEANAVCAGCNTPCGKLRVKFNTIFGLEEDRRVLNGRWRVY